MIFYLGAHHPGWLRRAGVPLFISRRRLVEYVTMPRAAAPWALDSGGFTELTLHGRWTIDPRAYVDEVRRYRDEVGHLTWAAIQDWMCEPWLLAKTGLSVERHQELTIDSYARLLDLDPDLPWMPVLQGWRVADYLRHRDAYAARGFDLARCPIVGVGSVCRRQKTDEAAEIIAEIRAGGVERLHGFGFKTVGLQRVGAGLASSDSMAWSFHARHRPPLDGCTHANCANCLPYALAWRTRLLRQLADSASRC